jgi:hypothetical protein
MPWRHLEEWKRSSTILDLGTRRRLVTSFTSRPLYPRNLLDMRLGEPHSRSGRWRQKKNLVPPGIWTSAVQPVAHRYTDWAIPAPSVIACRNQNQWGNKVESYNRANNLKHVIGNTYTTTGSYNRPAVNSQGGSFRIYCIHFGPVCDPFDDV